MSPEHLRVLIISDWVSLPSPLTCRLAQAAQKAPGLFWLPVRSWATHTLNGLVTTVMGVRWLLVWSSECEARGHHQPLCSPHTDDQRLRVGGGAWFDRLIAKNNDILTMIMMKMIMIMTITMIMRMAVVCWLRQTRRLAGPRTVERWWDGWLRVLSLLLSASPALHLSEVQVQEFQDPDREKP